MSYKRKTPGTSLEEIRFFYFIKQVFPEAKNRFVFSYYKNKSFELDIFIPHLNLAIEYDGVYFHSSKLMIKKDLKKNDICHKNGIALIRIREKGLKKILSHDIEYNYQLKNSHKESLKKLLHFIQNNFQLNQDEIEAILNFDYDKFEIGPEIIKLYEEIEYNSSLKIKNPTLSSEWNCERNNGFSPEKIKPNSNLLVWWKCNCCSHEWQATVHERHRSKLGCFRCRSLAIKNPELSKEWHPTKNNITPFDVTASSNQEVWWLCSFGGEYRMTIDNRRRRIECPCHSITRYRINESNSLANTNPKLAKEWHPTLNGHKTPHSVFSSSRVERAWWQCSANTEHVWESAIFARHQMGQGCPYCNGKKVSKENSLAQNKPGLAKQWHSTKNNKLTPETVTISSGKRVWWICKSCNYEWEANINNRVRTSGKCPNCKKN